MLDAMMYQTSDNSQLLKRVLWINAKLTIVWSLKHHSTQLIFIFNWENPQNSETPNGPRRGLDFIALTVKNQNSSNFYGLTLFFLLITLKSAISLWKEAHNFVENFKFEFYLSRFRIFLRISVSRWREVYSVWGIWGPWV